MNIIVVDNIYSKIIGDRLPNLVLEQLNNQLSYSLQNAYFIVKNMNAKAGSNYHPKKEWDGKVKLFWYGDKGGQFYTGMVSDVIKIFKENKIIYKIEDNRVRPPQNCPNLAFKPLQNAENRPYQDWTVDIAYKATRGIVEAACGSGKTYVASQLIGKIKTVPFLFMVLSTDLLDQAQEMLSDCLNVPIGKIGDGVVDIQDISVITVQTAIRAIHLGDKKFKIKDYKYDEDDNWNDDTIEKTNKGLEIQKLIAECKGVVGDEIHHASSKVFKEVLRFAKQAYWKYGFSATPYREDGQEMMIQALFGKKLVQVSASYLIKHNFLVKPYIFDVHINKNPNLDEFNSYSNIYTQSIVNNEVMNKLVIELANYFEKNNITTLILVQQYTHGDNLKAIRPDLVFIKGNQPKKQRKQALKDLKDGTIKIAIATTLPDERLDIKRLGAVIVAGGGKSITRVYQRVGRALRKFSNKDKAIVILFRHKCKFLEKHGKRVCSLLKKEKEFVVQQSSPENIFEDIKKIIQ
jgi:superfamily II DNA or RNA helicase